MDRMVTKTVDAIQRFGERLERRLSTGDDDDYGLEKSGSGYMHSNSGSTFHRPLDGHPHKDFYSSRQQDFAYGGAEHHSSDNLAANPGAYNSFHNYRQGPMDNRQGPMGNPYGDGMIRPPYGAGMPGHMHYGHGGAYPGPVPHGGVPGSVGYAPDYYIAERRQVELVPAPPPRYIRQPVPVPFPVDRPVPQPYPVEVPRPVHIDRPVPVPVPSPVPYDRPVPFPVPVPVHSPPVRVPVPVPCYVPVGVPVPSPPPSPAMVENSVTYSQRWVTGSPVMMNQQRYLAGSPVMGMNPCITPYGQGPFIR
ncbi:unnamed protein product [Rotaria sp. Silwood2]|nr:unnamed protein product [Rotaria sp. Silwood2]CAF2529422.1 unnamed protein product [Rotaria sp. Silwood2]CAF2763352.1 unnamed protein product [Rotaria sp. Silwood2]CAF2940546.1 unnamed protein product [Rotaria sp. Silwood2]CAF3864759.1 unnamed protein product [Rotaria sp. Silwood2]